MTNGLKLTVSKYVAFAISARSIANKTQCGDRVSVQDWAQDSMKHLKV